jgi:hypothetical protein
MAKADRIVSYFPSPYQARRQTKLLYDVVSKLAGPLEEFDTHLFRIQRAHRLKVAEHAEDIVRLAAALNLTPFHFEDILSGPDLSYEDRLARLRERVWRIAQVHLVGLGTPVAVLEATAIFLDATLVPERPGDALIKHLDDGGFSHVARIEFGHLPDKPLERLYLHENPLVRRKEEPTARWPLTFWSIENRSADDVPVTLSIQGVDGRTVLPTIFCPDTGEGIVFNGVVPDGKTLLIDAANGARLDGTSVDEWLIYYRGGIFNFSSVASAPAVVQEGQEGTPFDGDVATASSEYQPRRSVPRARAGASRWYFDVARGIYDGSAFDDAIYDVLPDPIGAFDGDFSYDACVFDYPANAIAGMAWDERLPCAFKLLLPAYVPPTKQQFAGPSPVSVGGPQTPPAGTATTPGTGTGAAPNYLGRVGGILPRFKAAGVRGYVDSARDAWILGESVLRGKAATDGEGLAFHATRVRDAQSDLFVDPETT